MNLIYRRRAGTVARHRPDQPRRWLDVGTASAHFCEAAAELFPATVFDGLDMSDGVLSGQRAGRIVTAHQGQFPDLSAQLAGRYDQVSMFHYLEHTRDPLADLDAAVTVLADDGWLLIEQPDPQARSARIFGSWWPGWNQPEHLNMVTLPNLTKALEERGFEIVEVVHRDAHIPLEAFIVLATVLSWIAPGDSMPWRSPEPPSWARTRRLVGKVLVAPLVPVALFIDHVVLPRMLHSYHAYRVIARRRPALAAT
jgi:SAM-dependent methyltransferase